MGDPDDHLGLDPVPARRRHDDQKAGRRDQYPPQSRMAAKEKVEACALHGDKERKRPFGQLEEVESMADVSGPGIPRQPAVMDSQTAKDEKARQGGPRSA